MKLENSIKGLIAILFIALCSSRPGFADDRSVLHYDHPIAENLKRLDHSVPRVSDQCAFHGRSTAFGERSLRCYVFRSCRFGVPGI